MIFSPIYAPLEKRLKRQVCGTIHKFRVLSHIGFEGILSSELSRLGFNTTSSFVGGITTEAKWADSWKILAFSRTARRLDMEIANFHAENFGKLEKEFEKIPWELYFPAGHIPQIKVKCKKSRLYHSDAIAERLQPILEKHLTETGIAAPEPKTLQRVILDFDNDICTAYVDMVGEALYRRGYNRFVDEAPLQETLAASILFAGGVTTAKMLIDPMCGSATFSLEAASYAMNLSTGSSRKFAIHEQPAFGEASYQNMLKHPAKAEISSDFSIYTADISKKTIGTASHNASACGVDTIVKPVVADFFKGTIPHAEGSLIVLNPPYGIRLQADAPKLYHEIAQKLKKDYSDCKVAILCPDHRTLHAFTNSAGHAIRTDHGGLNIFAVFSKIKDI